MKTRSFVIGLLMGMFCLQVPASDLSVAEVKAQLQTQLRHPHRFIADAPQILGLNANDPKAAIVQNHLRTLLNNPAVPELLLRAMLSDDEKRLTQAEAQEMLQQLYQICVGSTLPEVRSGLLRLSAEERKRLFIYDLSQVNYLDDESCSRYLSGSALLPPADYAQAAAAFIGATQADALNDYYHIIETALQAELTDSPQPAILSAEEELQGKAAYSAALDYFLEHNPELRPTMAKVLLNPKEASATESCLVHKSLLLVLLSIKGQPGNLALLTSLKQSARQTQTKLP